MAPAMAFLVTKVLGGGYFTRYGLGACIPIAIGIAWLSLAVAGPDWRHARLLPLLAIACFGGAVLWEIHTAGPRDPGAAVKAWLPPGDAPLVIADGQTFLQLDHYLDTASAARLVFLTDHDSAMRYMGSDCYDGVLRIVRPWFPIRGALIPYDEFIARRKPFLVYGKINPWHSWIWRRLEVEGISWQVKLAKDGMQLVEATP